MTTLAVSPRVGLGSSRPSGSFRQGQLGMTDPVPSGGAKSNQRKGPDQVDEINTGILRPFLFSVNTHLAPS